MHVFFFNSGSTDLVKFLIENGADVNAKPDDGITVLYWSARYGNYLNIQIKHIVWRRPFCKSGKAELVDFLIERGANINIKSKEGETELYWAAKNGSYVMNFHSEIKFKIISFDI